jgi:hypothetical protein
MRKPDCNKQGIKVWNFGNGIYVIQGSLTDRVFVSVKESELSDNYIDISEAKAVKKSLSLAIALAEELEKQDKTE